MRRTVPLAIVGGFAAAGEAGAGIVALATLGPAKIALFLLACGLATAATTAAVAVLIARLGGSGDPPGGGSTGGPPPRGPQEPPWWPSFERDFWSHVRRRSRTPV